jgi:citrate lyase subunit beta/citryl-CoA lyase
MAYTAGDKATVGHLCITPLFVPADRPERYAKAAASGADAIFIDLEDAVAPEAKVLAREAVCRPGALPNRNAIFVRVNGPSTQWYADDISAVCMLRVTGVVVPKVESAADIKALSDRLDGRPIIAFIESARGLAAARDIVRAPGVARLAFGSFDFSADIGAGHTRDALLAARSEVVLASRLGDVAPPIDGVTTSIDDADLIADDARYALTLGFGGKLCIHPRQIKPARRGFASSADEINWAKRILSAAGEGAISVDGAMVDAPVRLRAQQILSRVVSD